MTLIITAGTRDMVFQIADTRLTAVDGSQYNDKNVKTTVVHCEDSTLMISYTGLAQISKQRTDLWLMKILQDGEVGDKTFPEVVKHIESELNKMMLIDSNLKKYTLVFVVGGLGINRGKRDIAGALITNNEEYIPKERLVDHKKIDGAFGSVFFKPNPGFKVLWMVYGSLRVSTEMKSIHRAIEKKIIKAKTNDQLDEVMHLLVKLLHQQREESSVKDYISPECTVAHVASDFKVSLFSFTEEGEKKIYPNVVSKKQ